MVFCFFFFFLFFVFFFFFEREREDCRVGGFFPVEILVLK